MSRQVSSTNTPSRRNYRLAIEFIDRTIAEIVAELNSEIKLQLSLGSDGQVIDSTMAGLLGGTNFDGEQTIRRIFRSPLVTYHLMDMLGIDRLSDFTATLQLALEAAIAEPIKLEVIVIWVDDLPSLEFKLRS